MITVKFYSLTDPITGSLTKDIGWERVVDIKDFHSRTKADGTIEVLKDTTVTKRSVSTPPEASAVEVSEKQYDSIDTSKESDELKKRRNFHYKLLNKLDKTLNLKVSEILPEVAQAVSISAIVATVNNLAEG